MSCVFCNIISGKEPANIVYEDPETLAFLDKYPQSRGHLQLVPKTHVRWIYDLPAAAVAKFFTTARKITHGIIPVLGANHVSWGTFGHEIPHAHLWIVPRYLGSGAIAEGGGKEVINQEELAKLISARLKNL